MKKILMSALLIGMLALGLTTNTEASPHHHMPYPIHHITHHNPHIDVHNPHIRVRNPHIRIHKPHILHNPHISRIHPRPRY